MRDLPIFWNLYLKCSNSLKVINCGMESKTFMKCPNTQMTISPKDIKLHKKQAKKSGSGGRLDLELILTSGGYHRAHCCYLMAIIAGADVMSGPVITMCWAHSLTAGHIASASKLLQLMSYCSCCYCL